MMHKLNNKGFSLIEVIVSMVLLSIIFIPITNGFIQSMKASEEAKIMQQSNEFAQTVMEDIKYLKIDEVVNKYSAGTMTLPTFEASDTVDFDFESFDPAIGKTLKAKINISKQDTQSVREINEVEMPQIYDMSSAKNVVGIAPELPDWVIYDFIAKYPSHSYSDAKDNFVQHYKIELEEHTPFPIVKMSVTYKNKLESAYTMTDEIVTKNMSAALENIYFYYVSTGDKTSENLTFVNNLTTNNPINIFISGQLPAPDYMYYLTCTNDELGESIRNYNVISNVKVNALTKVFNSATSDKYVNKNEAKTRRYHVTVSVCKKIDDATYSNDYCVLESTRGE